MKIQNEQTGKEKKAQRRKNKEGLNSYYTRVLNLRTGYTKLVSKDKAAEYVYGKRNPVTGELKQTLKDNYKDIGKVN